MEWVPYPTCESKVIFAQKRDDWVEDIPLEKVASAVQFYCNSF